MRILIACEYSGTVRDAFRARGHDAMSCDLLPTERPPSYWPRCETWCALSGPMQGASSP